VRDRRDPAADVHPGPAAEDAAARWAKKAAVASAKVRAKKAKKGE